MRNFYKPVVKGQVMRGKDYNSTALALSLKIIGYFGYRRGSYFQYKLLSPLKHAIIWGNIISCLHVTYFNADYGDS